MGAENIAAAPQVVNVVCKHWLGTVGSILALLGVVAAPITSGDTALRSARLIVADALKIDQKAISKRLMVSIPIFVVTGLLLWFNIANANGFDVIWRYFGWSNQALSIFTFWALTVYLVYKRKEPYYLMTLFPACFMTSVCLTFICTAKIGFNIPQAFTAYIGIATFVISLALFVLWKRRHDAIQPSVQ